MMSICAHKCINIKRIINDIVTTCKLQNNGITDDKVNNMVELITEHVFEHFTDISQMMLSLHTNQEPVSN